MGRRVKKEDINIFSSLIDNPGHRVRFIWYKPKDNHEPIATILLHTDVPLGLSSGRPDWSIGGEKDASYCAVQQGYYHLNLRHGGYTIQPSDALLKVYPNPTRDLIHVELEGNEVVEGQILLYDINGQPRISKTFNKKEKTAELSLSDLPKGMYYLRIQTGEQMYTRRVLKL